MLTYCNMRLAPSWAGSAVIRQAWEATELGPAERWPPALKTAVQLCLNSRLPTALIWGDGDVLIYNDALIPALSHRHPDAFGRSLAECPELERAIGPMIRTAQEDGEPSLEDNFHLPLYREGRWQEAYFRVACAPLFDERGRVRGASAVVEERTFEVLEMRRSRTVGWLAEGLSRRSSNDGIASDIRDIANRNPWDFARATLIRVYGNGGTRVRWSIPEDFASALSPGVLDPHLEDLASRGRRASIDRLGERTFALSLVDRAAFEGAVVLVVQPDDRVRIGSLYEAMLRLLLNTMIGAVYRMLTERRTVAAIETQRDERDLLYRALFEHSPDGVFICSRGGEILATNPAGCDLLGFSEAEIAVLGRAGIVPNEDGQLSRALAIRAERGRFVGELSFLRRDGTRVLVDVTSTTFEDEVTGDGRAVVFFRDAGPRVAAEQRIAAAARLEALGAMTGAITHDFNNFIGMIINGAEGLAEQIAEDDGARPDVDLVLHAARQAVALTRQLLAFGRQQPMAPEPVNLRELLLELNPLILRAVGPAVSVTIQTPADLWMLVDAGLLQSAIMNLCLNARDAMASGGQLSIHATGVEVGDPQANELKLSSGRYIRLTVSDTGVGIAPENLSKVLEPFFTTKSPGEGTGLGLSTVFGFMRQSNGSMRLVSTVGAGTDVELYLPIAAER